MRTWQLGPTLRSIHSPHSQGVRGRGLRSARSLASNRARRVSPQAMGAWLNRSSSRRIAAFIASSEKKVSRRSTSRMRDWTAPTQASTSPLSVARPERAGSTATP